MSNGKTMMDKLSTTIEKMRENALKMLKMHNHEYSFVSGYYYGRHSALNELKRELLKIKENESEGHRR